MVAHSRHINLLPALRAYVLATAFLLSFNHYYEGFPGWHVVAGSYSSIAIIAWYAHRLGTPGLWVHRWFFLIAALVEFGLRIASVGARATDNLCPEPEMLSDCLTDASLGLITLLVLGVLPATELLDALCRHRPARKIALAVFNVGLSGTALVLAVAINEPGLSLAAAATYLVMAFVDVSTGVSATSR